MRFHERVMFCREIRMNIYRSPTRSWAHYALLRTWAREHRDYFRPPSGFIGPVQQLGPTVPRPPPYHA
jgi:hypothetical protein